MTTPADAVDLSDDRLSFRQLRFIYEYLKDQNASAAAVRAGYSAASRASVAHELMNNEAVRERLRMELQSLLAEVQCSEMDLIRERRRAAFFRAEKMFKAGWEVLPLDEMEEETRRALQVSMVIRKSGPVVRVRQPDRDRSLRALERVHERLEKLNEAYYARLEKAGAVRSLAQIEAMDAGVKAPGGFAEKDQVLSGGGIGPVHAGAGLAGREISEKSQVLSGGPVQVPEAGNVFSEKPQVFSGSGGAEVWRAGRPVAAAGEVRAA